jgi:hypothetical protein
MSNLSDVTIDSIFAYEHEFNEGYLHSVSLDLAALKSPDMLQTDGFWTNITNMKKDHWDNPRLIDSIQNAVQNLPKRVIYLVDKKIWQARFADEKVTIKEMLEFVNSAFGSLQTKSPPEIVKDEIHSTVTVQGCVDLYNIVANRQGIWAAMVHKYRSDEEAEIMQKVCLNIRALSKNLFTTESLFVFLMDTAQWKVYLGTNSTYGIDNFRRYLVEVLGPSITAERYVSSRGTDVVVLEYSMNDGGSCVVYIGADEIRANPF